MSKSVTQRLRYLAGATALMVLLGGCGGGGEEVRPGQTGQAKPTTTEATSATTTTVAESSGGVSSAGRESVDGVYAVDGEAPDNRVINLVGGVFLPSTLTVQVGDVVTFKGKGSDAYQLSVGSSGPLLVSQGILETYRFDKPGEISVSHDGSDDTATITVEGDGTEATTTTVDTLASPDQGTPPTPQGGVIPNSQTVDSSAAPGGSTEPENP